MQCIYIEAPASCMCIYIVYINAMCICRDTSELCVHTYFIHACKIFILYKYMQCIYIEAPASCMCTYIVYINAVCI